MTQRHFPYDREIDQWLASYVYDGNDASPVLDHLQAATADSLNRFRTNAPMLVAAGLAAQYFEVPAPTGPRFVARYGS